MASIIKVDQIQTAAGGTPTAADLGITGTGKVLQVVAVNGRSQDWLTTSTSNVQVNSSSITITPTSASSRIFVTWQVTTHIIGPPGGNRGELSAYRGATDLGNIFGTRNVSADNDYFDKTTQVSIIDHPNTTNATTYSLYARSINGGSFYAHRAFISDDPAEPRMRIVAMEIDMSTEWTS